MRNAVELSILNLLDVERMSNGRMGQGYQAGTPKNANLAIYQ
ncbi:hypothetical protein BAC1_00754 [uncultured bacterium]|nr:hypothetical protein BAC1_00754 [uncultured bacterium]